MLRGPRCGPVSVQLRLRDVRPRPWCWAEYDAGRQAMSVKEFQRKLLDWMSVRGRGLVALRKLFKVGRCRLTPGWPALGISD